MLKLKTMKNIFVELEDSANSITHEEYEIKILDESVEKLKSGKAVFYTHEEFWKIVRNGMEKDYEAVSDNIWGEYV